MNTAGDQELGAALRALRKSAGLTLPAMAAKVCYTKGHLSACELGKRRITPDVVAAYDRALGGNGMKRRELLAGLLGGAVAPAAMFDGIRAGFEAALNNPRPDVDEWQATVAAYGRDYMLTGAGQLQARLARDLIVLQTKLDVPELWGAAARLLTVHGKTIPSADRDGAVKWYRTAAAAADKSGDLDTRVWVRGRAALALAYEAAELPTAKALAEQAIALGGKPSLGALNAHMALAHVWGAAGAASPAMAALGAARRVFDAAGSHEQISDFAVPEWRMHTFTSMLLSRLGDPGAQAEQDAADATRPAELPRFATHIELHRALMLRNAGDRAGGVAYAQAAMDRLPTESLSLSLRLMLKEITDESR